MTVLEIEQEEHFWTIPMWNSPDINSSYWFRHGMALFQALTEIPIDY